MDNSGLTNGSLVKNQDLQTEGTQEVDKLTSEWTGSASIGSLKLPEYKGGGSGERAEGADTDDVVIEFADGIRVDFNRRNLAAESNFFRALFTSNFKDSKTKTITLPTITSSMFQNCLSFAYASQVFPVAPEISLQTAVDMMPVASYLCMYSLLELLSDAIHSNVETASILPAYRMAASRHPPLAKRLWNTLIRKFRALVVNGEHLQLTEDEFLAAFEDKNLNIPSNLEATVLKEYINNYPDDTRICSIAENLSFTGDGVDTYGVHRNRIPNEVVLSLGGWCSTGPSEDIETYNTRNKRWMPSSLFKSDVPRAYHAFNILNNHSFLVCGGMNGREHFKRTSIFDIRNKEWNQLADMHERRCYITGSIVPNSAQKNLLMTVGGFNGFERTKTCEMLDLDLNIWQTIPNMSKPRSDYGFVAVGSQLAVVGGFDGRQTHSDVEMYCPETNQWYPLNRPMRSRRTGVCAVALDSNVFLCVGGFDGSRRLKTSEMYDMREGQWHWIPQMNTPRSNFGIEFMDGCIYAVGGYDGSSTTKATERFDLAAQKWEPLSPLHGSKSALKVVRLSDSDLIRNLIEFEEAADG